MCKRIVTDSPQVRESLLLMPWATRMGLHRELEFPRSPVRIMALLYCATCHGTVK